MTIRWPLASVSPLRARSRVVAERQVGRHGERRLADPAAVDLARLDPVVDLLGPALAAVLELDPHLDRVAVGHVHRHPGRLRPRPSPRVGGSIRSHGSCSVLGQRAPPGRRVSTPIAASTASIVSALTWTGRPRQSAYSVITPYACASSTSGPVGDVTAPSLSGGGTAATRAGDRNRTRDILLTRKALYQLSYTGMVRRTS